MTQVPGYGHLCVGFGPSLTILRSALQCRPFRVVNFNWK